MDTRKIVEQQWHIVCGSVEIEELTNYKKITVCSLRNKRHALFLTIKHPGHRFYRGGWGPELLHFTNENIYQGPVGKIFCSYNRYKEISDWFLKNMFPP